MVEAATRAFGAERIASPSSVIAQFFIFLEYLPKFELPTRGHAHTGARQRGTALHVKISRRI